MARIDLIREGKRPKMNARSLIKGPSGSGKTFSSLSMARHLVGPDGSILVIDTERESALTYADVFRFEHLPWRPPYDPAELTTLLDRLGDRFDAVLVDSMSHFWRGAGGTLDIAGGRVQGGWDKARPIQEALVEQILAMPCHMLLCARMKNTVLVSDGGKTVTAVGLEIIQDDSLEYELNIVMQMDLNHQMTVTKSRTPAVPVGRMYPAGMENKLGEDYAEWLAGGIPPANREDVDAIVSVFAGIADRDTRAKLKAEFVEAFGMPHSMTAERVPAARAWLEAMGAPVGEGPAATAPAGEPAQSAESEPEPETAAENAEPAPDAENGAEAPDPARETDPPSAEPLEQEAPPQAVEPVPVGASTPGIDPVYIDSVVAHVKTLRKQDLVAALADRNLATNGNTETLGRRLSAALIDEGWQPAAAQPALA